MKCINQRTVKKCLKWNSGISSVQTVRQIRTQMYQNSFNYFGNKRNEIFLQKHGWDNVRNKTSKLLYSRYTHTGFIVTKKHTTINSRKNFE